MLLVLFISLLFAFSLISGRLEKTIVTAPIIFTLAGICVFPAMESEIGRLHAGAFLTLAEIGLVLLLFTDASRTDLKILRNIRALPGRLLGIGMPLTVLLGALAAKLVFPQLTIWEAGILSAILASTDAGLGQIIVNSPLVPMRVRQALNVEAGLNDGMAVPFMLFFIAMAAAGADDAGFTRFLGEQLGLGVAPFVYALLSLTIVRMLPVAVSLLGSGLGKSTVVFMGWFGPRGLASIVLGLVYLEEQKHLPGEQTTRLAVMATVFLSILAHGLSAAPGIRLLSRLSNPLESEPKPNPLTP